MDVLAICAAKLADWHLPNPSSPLLSLKCLKVKFRHLLQLLPIHLPVCRMIALYDECICLHRCIEHNLWSVFLRQLHLFSWCRILTCKPQTLKLISKHVLQLLCYRRTWRIAYLQQVGVPGITCLVKTDVVHSRIEQLTIYHNLHPSPVAMVQFTAGHSIHQRMELRRNMESIRQQWPVNGTAKEEGGHKWGLEDDDRNEYYAKSKSSVNCLFCTGNLLLTGLAFLPVEAKHLTVKWFFLPI